MGPQLVNKFSAFYGSQTFISTFTRARQLSLFWARSIQATRRFSGILKTHGPESDLSDTQLVTKIYTFIQDNYRNTYCPQQQVWKYIHENCFFTRTVRLILLPHGPNHRPCNIFCLLGFNLKFSLRILISLHLFWIPLTGLYHNFSLYIAA